MIGMKYAFIPPSASHTSPDFIPSSRPFGLDQQMRLFIAEKRTVGLPHHQQPSFTPPVPPFNMEKSLPTPPGPIPSSPVRERKIAKPSKNPSKSRLRFTPLPSRSRAAPATATPENYYQPSERVANRTELRSVPYTNRKNPISSDIMFTSASSMSTPLPSKFKKMIDPWQQQSRPASFMGLNAPKDIEDFSLPTLTSLGLATPPQLWANPERSPLLPPPRGNNIQARRSADLRIVFPPSMPLVATTTALTPKQQAIRASTSPIKRRGLKRHRTRTSEVLGSVLGVYPGNKPRTSHSRNAAGVLADNIAQRILSQRITIDSQVQTPRTPPPPPTPAKSRAQRERARMLAPPLPTLTPTPLPVAMGFVAELEGSFPMVPDMEAKGEAPSAISAQTSIVNSPPKRKGIKHSKIESSLLSLEPQSPKGKEIYAHLPLPAIPTPSQSRSPSHAPSSIPRSSESSPVIDIELEVGDIDGLVEWFENFQWGEVSSPNPDRATVQTSARTSQSSDTIMLPIERIPGTHQSAKSTFNVEDRASVLDFNSIIGSGEPFFFPRHSTPPGNNKTSKVSGLLSPVYPLSPRLTSYYGARSSIASSVGDAFRFDSEMREELRVVDEEREGCGIDETDTDELYRGKEHEDEDNVSDTSSEFDTILEQEIEMILSGTYGGGSPDDWRDDIYSAGPPSPEQNDKWEGDIIIELDIDVGMQMVEKAEEMVVGVGVQDGVRKDEGWRERPRTRYIAGRNSMLDNDAIFCLRGVDSM